MRSALTALVVLMMLLAVLSGCNNEAALSAEAPPPEASTAADTQAVQEDVSAPVDAVPAGEPENTAMLCADFSGGNPDGDVQIYEMGYSGELTLQMLAEGLSSLTGLDFAAGIVETEMGICVDWKMGSTLITGLDGREQKDGFAFANADSLRWFMMDSMYETLAANFQERNIFYTMEGELDLRFDELYPADHFPGGIPYMGSAFYFEHSDGRGLIYSEEEACFYLTDALVERGYDMAEMLLEAEPENANAWFGDMAVWYFGLGDVLAQDPLADAHFAVTYDWEIWEYDSSQDEWIMWQ